MIGLQNIGVKQGAFTLSGIHLMVPQYQYAVLMGRTGSGKTTLVEVLAGLRMPTMGRVFLNGRDVTELPPADRQLGYVPQDRALFRTLTVAENLAFGPRVRGWSEADIQSRVDAIAQSLSIPHLLTRYPTDLSGGEAARVALGRAIAYRPGVLLFDEPLSGLDEPMRDEIIGQLQALRDQRQFTILHITHSQTEAKALADAIYRMEDLAQQR